MSRITINDVRKNFFHLYENICDQEFSKTHNFALRKEQYLLSRIRFYLLGWFGYVSPEKATIEGRGRIDFVIGNTAVEFAVRTPSCPPSKLFASSNCREVEKLITWDRGPSALVLYDFSDSPLKLYHLHKYEYDHLPFRIKGNDFKFPKYSVLYYYLDNGECKDYRKNISVK